MKRLVIILLFSSTSYILITMSLNCALAQPPGEWTWMNGNSLPNQSGVFGVLGIPSVTNNPPTFYEACEWTDHQGNFWLYGGNNWQLGFYADMWKYDPSILQWTWIKGPGVSSIIPNYGVQGVSAPSNTPGSRGWGSCTWVDTSGNLWLFGGYGLNTYNDMWKYDIAINEWTWIAGSSTTGNYGIQGIPSPANLPPLRMEVCASWSDNQNNLWFYGGGDFGDLWKYSIASGWWTWMSGSDIPNPIAVYGTLGTGSTNNTPGQRWPYSKWKDASGNFWFFGGSSDWNLNVFNDLWKYNPSTNEWTWIGGPNYPGDQGQSGPLCTEDPAYRPSARTESRVCWSDDCGNFWLYGGLQASSSILDVSADLWKYNVASGQWSLISGTTNFNTTGNFGTKGISSPLNQPPARFGGLGWKDINGAFWMFGGRDFSSTISEYGDLWRYVPDTTCTCSPLPVAAASADNFLCPGTCTDFLNLSLNATNYQWSFPGATPDTSSATNPANICYTNPGNYDVTLIATNATGSDTLTLSNYITVYPQPLPQGILQSGDTLFANAGAVSYQWFYNGNLIPGATNYSYIAQASGDYNVVATDINGCEVEAVINDVLADLNKFPVPSSQLAIFPNPVDDKLTIQNFIPIANGIKSETAVEISIYNVLGEKMIHTYCSPNAVDCKSLTPGFYILELVSEKIKIQISFMKQ